MSTATSKPAPVVCLMGPTAAGKTDLAVELTRRFAFDIVSVDSAMVYRRLNIGSGKPDAEVLSLAPHRLIDIREPQDPYSAADFRRDALIEIDRAHGAGRIPLLVGGTGLYFRALLHGLSQLPAADATTRSRIEAQARIRGWAAMHDDLARADPVAASRIHPNDPQRIQRALEVIALTGKPLSEQQALKASPQLERQSTQMLRHPVVAVSIEPSQRERLHRAIETRFLAMLGAGLVDEVRALRAEPRMHASLPAARAVGYRQVWALLDGEIDERTMTDRAIAATRQLARRQLTWLRGESDLTRFDCNDPQLVPRVTGHLNAALAALAQAPPLPAR